MKDEDHIHEVRPRKAMKYLFLLVLLTGCHHRTTGQQLESVRALCAPNGGLSSVTTGPIGLVARCRNGAEFALDIQR
jgi:hypothetical protein